MRASWALLLCLVACSSSGRSGASRDAGSGPEGVLTASASGYEIARAYDQILETEYYLRCAYCPCNGIEKGSEAGERCSGAVLDIVPAAKEALLCNVNALGAAEACFRAATDCPAMDRCQADLTAERAACPSEEGGGEPATLPPECSGLVM